MLLLLLILSIPIKEYKISEFPNKIDDKVEYVIITTDLLLTPAEEYRKYKYECGVNCVVKTIEWIESNYFGSDTQERIRNFLRDAYNNWHTEYVLLMGDLSIVPSRYVYSGLFYGGILMPTDQYYACLNNSWNANENELCGEISDSVDYTHHLFVGRFPGLYVDDIQTCINKSIEWNEGKDIVFNEVACVAEALHGDSDIVTANECRVILNMFPDWFKKDSLYSIYPGTLTPDTIRKTLKAGKTYIYMISHGSAHQWLTFPRLGKPIVDTMITPNFFITISSCFVHWVDGISFSRVWMLNNHGPVFYFGPVRLGWDKEEAEFNKYFYEAIFHRGIDKIGKAIGYAKDKIAYNASYGYTKYREIWFGYLLYGDPGLLAWTCQPDSFIVDAPQVIPIGENEINIIVRNSQCVPVESALVCISQEGAYGRGYTDSTGKITFISTLELYGELKLVVSKQNFIPYKGAIFVAADRPWIRYKEHTIDIGIASAGRTINLGVTLENTGTACAYNTIAKLETDTTFITLIDTIKYYGEMAPNQTKTKNFVIKISKNAHITNAMFKVIPSYSIFTNEDTFSVKIYAPKLDLFSYKYLISGDTIKLSVKIKNEGNDRTNQVQARLYPLFGVYECLDIDEFMGEFLPSKVYNFENCFTLRGDTNLAAMLIISDSLMRVWSATIRLHNISPPQEIKFVPKSNGVTIIWNKVECAYGYNIYRAEDTSLLNNSIITENSEWCDTIIQPYTYYSYFVTAVDSFLNESNFSQIVRAKSNPEIKWCNSGFIVGMTDFRRNGPVVADLIPQVYGKEIIITGNKDRIMYAWEQNGEGLISSSGYFTTLSYESWSTPVIADINNDGEMEIVWIEGWKGNPFLYVFRNDGSILLSKQIIGNITFSSPTVQDLDNDGKLEIIITLHDGRIFVFKSNGEGFIDTTGFFSQMEWNTNNFYAPGVADIDDDGELEIVTTDAKKVYVWKKDGNIAPGWPINVVPDTTHPWYNGCNCAIADLLPNESGLEIIANCVSFGKGIISVLKADGSIADGWPKIYRNKAPWTNVSYPAVGDIDNDGNLEIVVGGAGSLFSWKPTGESLFYKRIPMTLYYNVPLAGPVIADVNGDDTCDIIFASFVEGHIYALNYKGEIIDGFPIMGKDLTEAPITVEDIDKDGNNELLIATIAPAVYVWELLGNKIEWSTFAHDRWHTSLYGFTPNDTSLLVINEIAHKYKAKFLITPNPFTNIACITYEVSKNAIVKLIIYDIAGREVKKLIEEKKLPGSYTLKWDGTDNYKRKVCSGIYFAKFNTQNFSKTQKIIKL